MAEGEARPLKIGIFRDIVSRITEEDGISKTQLRTALRVYTSSWRYLYGVKEGAKRVDRMVTIAAIWKRNMLNMPVPS